MKTLYSGFTGSPLIDFVSDQNTLFTQSFMPNRLSKTHTYIHTLTHTRTHTHYINTQTHTYTPKLSIQCIGRNNSINAGLINMLQDQYLSIFETTFFTLPHSRKFCELPAVRTVLVCDSGLVRIQGQRHLWLHKLDLYQDRAKVPVKEMKRCRSILSNARDNYILLKFH